MRSLLGIPVGGPLACHPAIVLGRGCGVRKESPIDEAEYLTTAGLLTQAIDYRSFGESGGSSTCRVGRPVRSNMRRPGSRSIWRCPNRNGASFPCLCSPSRTRAQTFCSGVPGSSLDHGPR